MNAVETEVPGGMTRDVTSGAESAADIPVPFRIISREVETHDVVTLRVRPLRGPCRPFEPAQFSMIGVVGAGEVPISISSRVDDVSSQAYTLRRAGAVTNALAAAQEGDMITVRGPFGVPWNLDRAAGRHAVFVAGGIGIAPLRAAIEAFVDRAHESPSRVTVLAGTKHRDDAVYRTWLDELAARGVEVSVAVDEVPSGVAWSGHVGFVTALIAGAIGDPHDVEAYVCGPDAMMRAAVGEFVACGVGPEQIEVTLERNMQCANGWCGHCQLGPFLVCRDGPVVRADRLGDVLERREL